MSALGEEDSRPVAGAPEATEAQVRARRNHMIGEWAAQRMGLDDVQAYARAVCRPGAAPPPDEDVARKLMRDLADSGLASAAHEAPARMEEFLALARAELAGGAS